MERVELDVARAGAWPHKYAEVTEGKDSEDAVGSCWTCFFQTP